MKGSGDADLYVGLDKAPSLKKFNFRPLKFGSDEEVIISSNGNIENVHLAVQGWRSLSEVSLKVTSEFAIPLCLSHNGGEGESFPCLDDRSCRLIDSKKGQSMENWCYFYLENRDNSTMSKELN